MGSDQINHYLHLFMMGNNNFQPGGIYLVYVSPSQKVDVIPFNREFTQDNIKSFVFEMYERYKFYFQDPKDDEHKKNFQVEEF